MWTVSVMLWRGELAGLRRRKRKKVVIGRVGYFFEASTATTRVGNRQVMEGGASNNVPVSLPFRELGNDDAQCQQRLVDVGAFLEALALSSGV